MGAKYRFALQSERGTSLETLWRARASCCEDDGTTWFFSGCGGILELRRGFQASSCVSPGSPSVVILEPRKIRSVTVSTVSPSISHEVMGPDAMRGEDWASQGQPKGKAEIPVVTSESRRNSRKTTWFPPLGKMRPLPATASQGKSHVPTEVQNGTWHQIGRAHV